MDSGFSGIVFNGFPPHLIVLSVAAVLLLCVSALVSGSETAFFSLTHSDVHRIRERRHSSDEAILRLLGNIDLLLATILVVNNLVNICIVILASEIIDGALTFIRFEFLFKTVVVTFLLLLFGEILPKVLAQTMPVRFAGLVARPMLVLRWIFYPLSYILVRTSSRISEHAAHKSEISIDELADVHASDRRLTEAGSAKFFVRDNGDTVLQERGILTDREISKNSPNHRQKL